MTPFISGPILQVQLSASNINEHWQEVDADITFWSIINILEINSNNDKNIHWARNQTFSILLDPSVVKDLDLANTTDLKNIRLQRMFDFYSGTETWQVL